ncbi:hypothetical protein NQZ68_010344 [Dissostichus eleginoides]|nr:hypothetical protein NQZ68_010344 [Dissostichus eleginoides]
MLLHIEAPWACACSSVVERTSTSSGFWTFSTCGQLDGSALASLSQRTHKTPVELCHDGACAELVCVVVGRGLYALYLKPHQRDEPCVMRSGRAEEGSPLESEEPPLRCRPGAGGQ